MPTLKFTVDSALLEELGERLVGKPYIALAELVKNSYDADATRVRIELNPENDCIVVSDNGYGMDFQEFKDFWMRIGSTHKQDLKVSRDFKRPMTGSKGVGRLAVQYLANEIELLTTSKKNFTKRLKARVKWEEAVKVGDLTEATAEYDIDTSDKGFEQGTKIVLTGLKHSWDADLIRGLAREIWWLKPPFRSRLMAIEERGKAFEIEFLSREKEYEKVFNEQMNAILDIWHARLVGKNVKGEVSLALQYKGEEPIAIHYSIPNCTLEDGDFEIRIYHLMYRQPHGIRVGMARKYFNDHGGVHVYDGGFHLPYYGDPKNDWLEIEIAHSHRLSLSQLLPEEFRIAEGLTFLPTLSRIFGVVNVDTSEEKDLYILITRDRLQESNAFRNLHYMVRWALDFYAYKEKLRHIESEIQERKVERPKYRKIEDVLEKYEPEIPEETFGKLRKDIGTVANEIETEAEAAAKRVGLMGSLATAGISTLAYQHETKSQFLTIEDIIERMDKLIAEIEDRKLRKTLSELKESLSSWVERARATNALFSYFTDPENIRSRRRFSAKTVVDEIKKQVEPLARGVLIRFNRLNDGLLLPEASLAEWGSIFQNVFINAFNALLDSEKKLVDVSSRAEGRFREILIQDTGCGVDLKNAEELFEPFVRRMKISPERRALGYGGTGLGLTIVRMIAHNIGCEVSFVQPENGFNTAFSLRWRESE